MTTSTLEPMSDEVIVNVFSALGQSMGSFLWHKDDLEVINKLDGEAKHCHVHYEGQKDGCNFITNPCDC